MNANTKRITSRDNPLVKQLVRLAHSARERRRSGVALLDGPHLIEAFAATGEPAQALVLADRAQGDAALVALFEQCPAIERVIVPDGLFDEMSGLTSPIGLLACAAVPDPGPLPGQFGDAVLLDRLQEPGNVGSILRSAAAAGIRTVIATPGTTFLWSPKVLRAGMGAHFGLRLFENMDPEQIAAGRPARIVATEARAPGTLYAIDLREPTLWLFGNEGGGLAPELERIATDRVCIPMPGGAESLNVAAAAAICLFEQVRQRTRPPMT